MDVFTGTSSVLIDYLGCSQRDGLNSFEKVLNLYSVFLLSARTLQYDLVTDYPGGYLIN